MDSIRATEATRHRRASELFLACIGRTADERRELLAERCADDEDLRREVESLLVQSARAAGFLESPADLSSLDAPRANGAPQAPVDGQSIAGYRVRRVLGWGSMGVVYLATQDAPRRDVALKVLRAEALSPALRRRFQRETELLARLNHPLIARIYEAGIEGDAAGGRPWFAMEYVAGRPLLEHCTDARLGVRERLGLFAEVCEGVHSAHEQGVVHRDIKPSNLLVDGDGRPRILDFGVARLIGSSESSTLLTTTGQLVGTLAYMSPEQAAGDGRAVDRRSDVYSLGVLLFELLTGELPQSTRGLDIPEAVRVIREDEPVTLRTLARNLDLDLETIAATALSKEPERRYASARDLALDVRRWLAHEPIQARPPSLVYQMTKLAHRHRALVVGTATTIAALALGLVVTLILLERTRVAEAKVRLELGETQRLNDLLELRGLEQRVVDLWPATSANAAALAGWIADARPIAVRRDLHRAWLTAAQLDPGVSDEQRAVARELVAALDHFCTPRTGALAIVEARHTCAGTLRERSIDGHAEMWMRAMEAIADPRRHPKYGGLEITPQEGLVPLGPDPDSGLWEFGLLGANGRLPARDPRTGRLQLDSDSSIVLVLLPGGAFWQGAQWWSPCLPNYDPEAKDTHEAPPRQVTLDPFFLSKYEITQGQHVRAMGDNPSYYEIGDRYHHERVEGRHPVEFLDWFMACELARRLDLSLPTEAQWEYAARGGTTTAYVTGEHSDTLMCLENLPGLFGNGMFDAHGNRLAEPDGFAHHAPVGSYPANPFGLHDMLGNVAEWCLDPYKVRYLDLPLRAGDGLVLATSPDRDRSTRGCSFGGSSSMTRSAARTDAREESREVYRGVRLARDLR